LNYFGIVKKAFLITTKNKFLWILGILAALTQSGSNFNFGNFSSADYNEFKKIWENNGNTAPTYPTTTAQNIKERVLGNKISLNNTDTLTGISNWLEAHWLTIIIILAIIILITIAVIVISRVAQAGLVWGVKEIEHDHKSDFASCIKKGYHVFWQVIFLDLFLALMGLALIFLVGLPVIFSFIVNIYAIGIIWMVIVILPMILAMIILDIIRQYGLRMIVIDKISASEALGKAFGAIRVKLKETSLIWLISVILGLIVGIIIGICFLIIGGLFAGIGVALYFIFGTTATIIYAICAFVLLLLVMAVISGPTNAFISSYWTLAYLELNKTC